MGMRKLTKELEVSLAAHKLVETDVGLDGDTRPRVSVVRVARRNDCKAFALWLPGEVADGVYSRDVSKMSNITR